MTEAAEASDTSCSPERPPKTTPTRRRGISAILAAEGGRPAQPDQVGPVANGDALALHRVLGPLEQTQLDRGGVLGEQR